MIDTVFKANIIAEICDYAVDNDMEPDEALTMIAEYILVLLKISTFNKWKKEVI